MGAGATTSRLVKQIAADNSDPTAGDINQSITQRAFQFQKTAADAMANTTTAESPLGSRSVAMKVKSISLQPLAAITADAANQALITVSKRTKAGGSKTTVGTLTTDLTLGNFAAFEKKEFTLTAANVECAADASLTYEISKPGTGVIVPISNIIVEYEET